MRSQDGRSVVELVVVFSVATVIALVLLHYMLRNLELAEKSAMETTVVNIKSGLRIQMAKLLVSDGVRAVQSLPEQNPIQWLSESPINYSGECVDAKPGEIPPGSWCYDPKTRVLMYWPNNERYFQPDSTGMKRARFQVRLTYEKEIQGNTSGSDNEVTGVILVPMEEYRWFEA